MKTRSLSTILTSAYLSAVLATSVAPVRSDAALASTIDPMAAQKALCGAINGLDAVGWLAASTTASVSVPPVAVVTPPPADPVMTAELMARLIKYTRAVEKTGALSAVVCKALDLCDGSKDMPLKYAVSDSTDGKHYFGLRPEAGSKDILIVVIRETTLEAYLTDKTGKLRAAAVSRDGTVSLITNESAAAKFKAELSLFAGEAGTLPPTGTAVARNS